LSTPQLAAGFHTLVVIGASGDLARKKIYPAIFNLFVTGMLPPDFAVVGYARTDMTREAFIERLLQYLSCRTVDKEACKAHVREFIARCHYVCGHYDHEDDFARLHTEIRCIEPPVSGPAHRLFYLAVPPTVFAQAAASLAKWARSATGWNRLILEKPFGRDKESSAELGRLLFQNWKEEDLYRIDHYLGKEIVQNLMVLRFANLVFEPIWDRSTVESVQIYWQEDIGTEGRGGYFDHYGILRDVMQNHLMQILALAAMEEPVSLDAEDVRDEKVKVLRAVQPLKLEDLVIGQYAGREGGLGKVPGYLEDPGVPPDSITPTFAAAVLKIRNRRWDGVPFLLRCGKAMDEKKTELRIRFRRVPGRLFKDAGANLHQNLLIIRVQPDEGIRFRFNNKIPGLGMNLEPSLLDLTYRSRYGNADIPEAYERLILDVLRGDKSQFIRHDELEAAWEIFTPVLAQLEREKVKPLPYAFGSRGPDQALDLAWDHGVKWSE